MVTWHIPKFNRAPAGEAGAGVSGNDAGVRALPEVYRATWIQREAFANIQHTHSNSGSECLIEQNRAVDYARHGYFTAYKKPLWIYIKLTGIIYAKLYEMNRNQRRERWYFKKKKIKKTHQSRLDQCNILWLHAIFFNDFIEVRNRNHARSSML